MTKSKVLDLASEVGIEDDKLLLKLKRMGVKVKDKKLTEPEKKASPLEEKIIERDSEKEIVEKRVKPTVIRRRVRNLEVKVETPTPLLAVVEPEVAPEVIKEKIPRSKEKEEKVEIEPEISKKAAEKKELEEEKPSAPPARGRKQKEAPEKPAISIGARAEEKEVLPPRPLEAVPSQAVLKEGKVVPEVIKEAGEPKPMEVPLKKAEAKLLEKEELSERERLGPHVKKKGLITKRKRIEEKDVGGG
jgi:translation initiation factor IF-2